MIWHSCTSAPQGHIFWSIMFSFSPWAINCVFGFGENSNQSWQKEGMIWPGLKKNKVENYYKKILCINLYQLFCLFCCTVYSGLILMNGSNKYLYKYTWKLLRKVLKIFYCLYFGIWTCTIKKINWKVDLSLCNES